LSWKGVFLRGWNVVVFLAEILIEVLDQIAEKQFQHYCSVGKEHGT
jgi:hypothetical protein